MPLYNYGFPMTYQPLQPAQVPQLQQQAQQPTQQNQSGIVWVQGEAGAKAYPVAPNTSLLLMDSETQKFYIKSADGSGMPLPLRVFNYTEETTQNVAGQPEPEPKLNPEEYLTRKEFEERIAELKPVQSRRKEKEPVEDE